MKHIGIILFFTLAFPAQAGAQDVSSCKKIISPSERLACFDDVHNTADDIRFSGAKDNAETIGTVTPQLTPEERFGKPAAQRKKEKSGLPQTLNTLSAEIEASGYTRNGNVRITLTNGQIWQQLNSDDTRVTPSRLRRQKSITIKRGALGSFIMKIEPWGRSMKVKRIS